MRSRAHGGLHQLFGDVALPMFEQVLVSDADLANRRAEIEECLDFVQQGTGPALVEEETETSP